ncbi:MAG: beta-propeller fold lactonase family protein [Planctomycetaceae bacterium]
MKNNDETRLYAAVRTNNEVVAYQVNESTGGLTELGRTPVLANPVYVATDKTGRFLLTAYYGEAKAALRLEMEFSTRASLRCGLNTSSAFDSGRS